VLDAKGQPVAGVNVNAQATERNEDLTDPAANSFNRLATSRSAVTSAKGEFEMQPLPPGKYDIQPAERASDYSIDPKDRKPRPLPAVFVATKVTLKEGAEPEPVEVRATPHVVIEAQVYDSKGQPTRGSGYSVSGQLDKVRWVGQMRADADGKMVAYVPHGLENAGLIFAGGSEHVVLRWRKVRDEPLKNIVLPSVGNISSISLSTLTDDVKGIEIVQYAAPVLLVKVSAKDGQQLKEAAVTAMYGPGKEQFRGAVGTDGRPSEVRFVHQEDGRFRSMLLFPDEETTVTAHAEGYTDRSVQVKLAEGATKEIEIVLEKAPQKNDEKK
jgi:hypothetical protein